MNKSTLSILLLFTSFPVICTNGSVNFFVGSKDTSTTEIPAKQITTTESVKISPAQTSANTLFVQTVQQKSGFLRRLGGRTGRVVAGAVLFTSMLAYKETQQKSQSTDNGLDHAKLFFNTWLDKANELYTATSMVCTDITAQAKNIAAMTGAVVMFEKMMKQQSDKSSNDIKKTDETKS